MTIKKLLTSLNDIKHGQDFEIQGWVQNNRGNEKIKFLALTDGSTVDTLQLVIKSENIKRFNLDKINLGSSIKVKGKLLLTPTAPQPIELAVDDLILINNTDEDFPIQKKETTLDFLREIPHLRHRTNLFRAIMIIRNALLFEIHSYFQKHDFLNIAAPIITSNDGEGAGETLIVDSSEGDFFKQKSFLGVTGQLHAEAYAAGFKKVYTFAPTFRAENSHTTKHLAEFWMIEPEVAFYELNDIIPFADNLLKTVISNVIKKYPSEMKLLDSLKDNNLITTLKKYISTPLKIMEYKEAIKILEKHKKEFEEQNIFFGMDLGSEHEKFIAEKVVNGPVAMINYPKDIKAFYMYQNDDKKTVAAFDLLVPGIGEIIGGSQREDDYDKLMTRINELGMDAKDYDFYLDLRKYGSARHAGFGLGFERCVMYITGMGNIRDVLPFPRTVGTCEL